MPAYNNIHRQQLFHWIGSHIDDKATGNTGRLTDDLREEYVSALRGALQNGLWVKTPRDPDFLGRGDLIKVTRPITCFTEWTLGQSLPHTTLYGRLGLGFPKRFVLARGGQPITYVRDSSRRDPYTSALLALARAFKQDPKLPAALGKKLNVLRDHFDYLSHFNKKIKRPAPHKVIPLSKKAALPSRRVAKPASGTKEPDPFVRSFGGTLHFLEEREWRIVFDNSLGEFFARGPGGAGQPEYFLPFESGRELFTVALPDNRTLNLAMQQKDIRWRLFPREAPHVTVLSLQDIGTF